MRDDIPVMTLAGFAARRNLVTTADVDSHIHANLRSKPETKSHDRRFHKELLRLQAARDETRILYRNAIDAGEIRAPTAQESLVAAAGGHDDNASTHAARRVLEKREARRREAMALKMNEQRTVAEIVETLNDEQIAALSEWTDASKSVPGWIDGYGLGGSYIDSRAKGGKGYAERRGYVALDHATAEAVPDLRGARWQEVAEAIAQRPVPAAAGMSR